jgi:malate synthase
MAHFAAPFTAPWYIDLLNINLNNEDLVGVRHRIGQHMDALRPGGHPHHTQNMDFEVARSAAA